MTARAWSGEALRWYLTRANHPFKNYIVGHYWGWFCKPRVWVRYDETSIISVSLRDYIQQRIFFDGYYERTLVDWMKSHLRPVDVFWDVGANVGAISLVAAKLCRQVVAFEPDKRSAALLGDNMTANGVSNVVLVPKALGAAAGHAVLHAGPPNNSGMSSVVNQPERTLGFAPVAVVRADDVVREPGILSPTVVKIDVEGAEHEVLTGAQAILASRNVRALIFEDRMLAGGEPANRVVVELLKDAGYDIEQLGVSALDVNDGLMNFLATPRRENDRAT